jgi:acyl-CoA synthetase (NDP forming)
MELAGKFMPGDISECEINPLVIADKCLVALDILIKLGEGEKARQDERPIHKIGNLLEPRSAAIIGVSEKLNPGHIILKNLIREGFDREQIFIVKPGIEAIEGCRCYPDVASLPRCVDLFILSIEAAQAPGVITSIVEERKAESIILIPGGLEEKQGTEAIVSRMHQVLSAARATDWQGPVINGGNCLGITSRPGRYDTMFIPEYKLPVQKNPASPVAILSQSGAFAVAKASKLAGINPKYSISLGNQMDLTMGDYLTYLKGDPDIDIFAAYVEGFRPLDGARFLEAAREITDDGKTVIFYRAGRTAAGARAAASHTASIAGDYAVTQQLAEAAGVVLAESISDFEDLIRLFTFLRDKEVRGMRLGAISNAGCECVCIADNLGELRLSAFSQPTVARLHRIFKASRIDQVVDVHNPIDLTPMASDAAFAEAVRAVMEDESIDVGIVGCVPLTAVLNTLPRGEGHRDDILLEGSIVQRLVKLRDVLAKPWVAVIDSGSLYDPMARCLEEGGIPTFRTADRALRLLNIFCKVRMKSAQPRHAL